MTINVPRGPLVPRPARKLRLALLYGLAGLLAVATINRVIDPYGAWKWAAFPRDRHRLAPPPDATLRRLNTAYRLQVVTPRLLLVGSSRVQLGIPVDPMESDVFNAGLPGASLREINLVVRTALRNPRLRRVVWGLDFYPFAQRYASAHHADTDAILTAGAEGRLVLRGLRYALLTSGALWDSIRLLGRRYHGTSDAIFVEPTPWAGAVIAARASPDDPRTLRTEAEDVFHREMEVWHWNYGAYERNPAVFALFTDTIARLRAAGIEVTVFLPPFSDCELQALEEAGAWLHFVDWKREVAAVTPFWDFSAYSVIRPPDELFVDAQHFTPAVGHTILRRVLGDDCRECGPVLDRVFQAGRWVDRDTVAAHVAAEERARAAAGPNGSRCEPHRPTQDRDAGAAPGLALAPILWWDASERGSPADRTGGAGPRAG